MEFKKFWHSLREIICWTNWIDEFGLYNIFFLRNHIRFLQNNAVVNQNEKISLLEVKNQKFPVFNDALNSKYLRKYPPKPGIEPGTIRSLV